MEKLERNVLITAGLVLACLVGLVVYSIFGLGIRLPGCVTAVKAFDHGEIIKRTDSLYEVHVLAKMWAFEPSEIRVKPGTTLDIYLASHDVTHGFQIENTDVNLMAVPGAVNYARVTLKEPGIYHIVCHEYCGAGHQTMSARIVVGNDDSLPVLLTQHEEPVDSSGHPLSAEADEGRQLFTAKGCVACHSINGNAGVGPTFKSVYGRHEKMSDGKIIVIDDAYITESIKEPAAKVVSGFQPLMPKLDVNDEEIKDIIAYLKTL